MTHPAVEANMRYEAVLVEAGPGDKEWVVWESGRIVQDSVFATEAAAQTECARLNAIAFLEAIREPSEGEIEAMARAICSQRCFRAEVLGEPCIGPDGRNAPCQANETQLGLSGLMDAARKSRQAMIDKLKEELR